MLKVYEYSKCSTCVKALKFLEANEISFNALPIAEKAPSLKELKEMLDALKLNGGTLKNLFNTSGLVYKEMKLSEKFPTLTEKQALDLLASNGKLVKRPFVIGNLGKKAIHLVGFKESQWLEALT